MSWVIARVARKLDKILWFGSRQESLQGLEKTITYSTTSGLDQLWFRSRQESRQELEYLNSQLLNCNLVNFVFVDLQPCSIVAPYLFNTFWTIGSCFINHLFSCKIG